MPKRVTCIFCEQRRTRAREDIIPKWRAKELGGSGPFYADDILRIGANGIQLSRDRVRKYGDLATLNLRDVGKRCNTGWMSTLERMAGPILLPMIRGEETILTPGHLTSSLSSVSRARLP